MAMLQKGLQITQKGVRALFVSSFVTRRRRLIYPKFCQVVDSFVESDFARTFGTVPPLVEVIDDVNAPPMPGFREYGWDWTNRIYKSRLSVSRTLLNFDQTGQTRTVLHSMAARLANFPDRLLATKLLNGSLSSGEYTGGVPGAAKIALFSASHLPPLGSSTNQSNILNGTTPSDFCASATVQTVAQQILNDFRLAKARLRSFLDDQGQPWHDDDIRAEDLIILCSPLLEAPMRQAFFTNMINASDNAFKGDVREIITSNYLPSATTSADAADWYLCHIGELSRPFIYSRFRRIRDEEIQDAFGSELTEVADEEAQITLDDMREVSSILIDTNIGRQGYNADADVIQNDRFLVAAQWRGEILGGEWRNAVQISNTAS